MGMDKVQEPGQKNNADRLKKLGGSLLGGLIFGLTAGLMMVVILAAFPGGGDKSRADVAETEIAAQKDKEKESIEDEAKTDSGKAESGGDIRTADSTAEDQTVVTDVTKVVDNVMPCVVSIFSTYVIDEDFWGYHYDYEAEGGGSGIIVGENETELLIVTNNHVVEDSKELTVQFIDDSVATALVKGTDADMDLAVIAIEIADLDPSTKETIRVATMGDSDKLKVGEPAIAIGNALGYGQSVTTGVISAVNRSYTDEEGPLYGGVLEEENYENVKYLIQTDAAINPGNSGGALLNVRGEVVGINSSKIAEYTVEGMGYAIPISTAEPIIEELMSRRTRPAGKTKQGPAYLGISGMAVSKEMLRRYDLKEGIYITQVFADTPAKEAGIKKGDILLSIDDVAIGDMDELSQALSGYEEGEEVVVKLLKRSNSGYVERELKVILGGRE